MNAQFYTAVFLLCLVACCSVSCVRFVLAQASMPFECLFPNEWFLLPHLCKDPDAPSYSEKWIEKSYLLVIVYMIRWALWSSERCSFRDLILSMLNEMWSRGDLSFALVKLILDFTWVPVRVHRACADAFDLVLEFFDLTAGASLICDFTLQERSLSDDLLPWAHLACPWSVSEFMNMRFSALEFE